MSVPSIIRFWLAVAGSVVSLFLSWPYWRDFGYWATSPALWRLYFIAGFCLAVFVFVVFLRSLATLFEHDQIARAEHQKRGTDAGAGS